MFKCMKDMEKVTLSPASVAKLKNKACAYKLKYGSPKLQEVLRERCRQRMKEKREQLFNKRRFGLETNPKEVQSTLSDIIRNELSHIKTTDLDSSLHPFSSIVNEPLTSEEALAFESEILNEEEQWILEEYERMLQEETELLALAEDEQADNVICPKCQKCNLAQRDDKVVCKSCDFTLSNNKSVKEVGYLINQSVNNHSAQCDETPGFLPFSENDITSLYLVCDKCSIWIPVL